jgi:AraC-like DNA-binding protein/mannose-6-phosphate isomerase-like protein (cupin superfamily)
MQPEEIPMCRFKDYFFSKKQFSIQQMYISSQQIKEQNIWQPHRHDFYEIIIFVKGSGIHHIDWNPYPIKDQTVFVILPGTVHLLELHGEMQAYTICFEKELILSSEHTGLFSLLTYIENHNFFMITDFSRLYSIVEQLIGDVQTNTTYQKELFKAYIQILLIQILQYKEVPHKELPPKVEENNTEFDGKNKFNPKLKAFKDLIDIHYKEHHSVHQYAALLAISTKHLNRTCKTLTGKTASTLIQERINVEAKRLLCNTNLSIKEIAFMLGFLESSHFSHFFSKQNGMFPRFFRKTMLNAKA